MKKIFFLAPVLMTIVATSCKDDPKKDEGVITPATIPSPTNTNSSISPQITSPTTNTPPVVVQQQQGATTPVNIQMPATIPATTTTTRTTVAAGMNPAHGEPGHRCDIPVGSPLNSPPAKANPTIQTTSPAPSSQNITTISTPPVIQTTPAKTVTAAGMNPPHGEPGHRCDIPVGSPLNSPKGAQPQPTITTVPATTPAVKQNN